jgi:hypothetical protein
MPTGGADAGQDHPLRADQTVRIAHQPHRRTQALQCVAHRAQVGTAGVDQRNVTHSAPWCSAARALPGQRRTQRARQRLEAGLDLVVIVVAAYLQVEVQAAGIAQRTEEVRHQLGRHIAHALALELALEHEVRAAAEIQRSAGQRLVHRQGEAVAADAALVAQRLAQRLAQGQPGVLDGVVLVDVQVTLGLDVQREAAVLADLFQHVVEERQAGGDARIARTVQVQFNADLRFFGVALDHGGARRVGQRMGNARPVPLATKLRGAQLETTDVEVVGKLQVGDAVTDHARTRPVDAAVLQVGGHQADAGLRVGALSCGQLQSISTSRKVMPWPSKICSIRSLGPSKLARG